MKKRFKILYNLYRRLDFLKNKRFYIGLFVFVFSIILNMISAWYILNKLPQIHFVLYDLILNNIPYYNVAFLSDLFLVFCFILFMAFVFHKKQENKIGYYLLLLGLFYSIRAILILITPLGNPAESYNRIFNGVLFDIGSFPSGHAGACFLTFLISKGIYKYLILFFSILLVAAILLSRSHYSIDIISSFIFVYAVYAFGQNYLKKYFEKK